MSEDIIVIAQARFFLSIKLVKYSDYHIKQGLTLMSAVKRFGVKSDNTIRRWIKSDYVYYVPDLDAVVEVRSRNLAS